MELTKEQEKTDKLKAKRYKALRTQNGFNLPDFSKLVEYSAHYKQGIAAALNYVNYCYDAKETAAFANDYSTTVLGYSVEHVPDYELVSLGHFSWLFYNKAWFSEERKAEIAEKFKSISDHYKKEQEKLSAADRISKPELTEKKQTSKVIELFEGLIDDVVFHNLPNCRKPKDILLGLPKANIEIITKRYREMFAEEDTTGLTDAEVKRLSWLKTEIMFSLEHAQSELKQATKKPRKASTKKKSSKPNPFKLVKNLKFLQNFPELNLISVSPDKIIGSSVLWVYNTKTKKLGRYVAADTTGLSVKGTSIIGFIEAESQQKMLKKPTDVLPGISSLGKVEQKTYLDNIKTKASNISPRITKDVILLKVY